MMETSLSCVCSVAAKPTTCEQQPVSSLSAVDCVSLKRQLQPLLEQISTCGTHLTRLKNQEGLLWGLLDKYCYPQKWTNKKNRAMTQYNLCSNYEVLKKRASYSQVAMSALGFGRARSPRFFCAYCSSIR